MKKIVRNILGLATASTLMLSATSCGSNDDVISITHKPYTEQRLLGQVLAVYLEDKGYETSVSELGGTMLCFNAIDTGEIDMYVEYTGTLYGAILEQDEILSQDDTYNFVKTQMDEQYDIAVLEDLGFNNAYVLSITKEKSEELGITTVSDLIPYASEYLIGCDLEFANRADGLPGLLTAYDGLEFKSVKSMDQGLTYQAVDTGEIDVNVSYSTDGRIAKFGLLNLIDDKAYFPPYYAVPVMKQEFADANPEVVAALGELQGQWSDEDMQNYNLLVEEGEDTRVVAKMMLEDRGLIN